MKFCTLIFTLVASFSMLTQAAIAAPGAYKDYSPAAFEGAKKQSRVLFFYAGWCPFCVANDKKLKAAEIPTDTTVFKVNFDSAAELKDQYGVKRQDTFVQVDESGNKIQQWSGLKGNLSEYMKK